MYRRTLLQTTAATVLTAGLTAKLSRPLLALSPPATNNLLAKNGIGLQLWTVRNQMAEDPAATLKAVADAGYKQVELMDVIGSGEIVKMAKGLGLEVRSAFFNWETIGNPDNPDAPSIDAVIEQAKEYGLEYLVFGYIGREARNTEDKLKAIADRTNAASEKVVEAGMQLSYHNHAFEFEPLGGDAAKATTGFDIFMERFDAKHVNFELDVFWVALGGWDPIETLKKLGQRVGQVHLKDLKSGVPTIYDEGKVPKDAFQEVGDGTIDMRAVMAVASENGVAQFHVEQDESPAPLESIQQSMVYVKKIW